MWGCRGKSKKRDNRKFFRDVNSQQREHCRAASAWWPHRTTDLRAYSPCACAVPCDWGPSRIPRARRPPRPGSHTRSGPCAGRHRRPGPVHSAAFSPAWFIQDPRSPSTAASLAKPTAGVVQKQGMMLVHVLRSLMPGGGRGPALLACQEQGPHPGHEASRGAGKRWW